MAMGNTPKWFLLGSDMFAPEQSIDVEKAIPHPQFGEAVVDGYELQVHDIAVLILAEPAQVEPMKYRTSSLVGTEGTPVTFVGFGQSSLYDENENSSGTKYKVASTIGDVNSHGFWNFTSPPNVKNTCGGDSGGPALLNQGGVEEVISVVSSGDPDCTQTGWNTRVDIHASWLQELINTYDSGAVDPVCGNSYCEFGETSQNCPQDCEESEEGKLGSPCNSPSDCKSGLICIDSPQGSFCSQFCPDPQGGTGCPAGYTCVPLVDPPPGGEGVCLFTGTGSECGNGECEQGETSQNCPQDCGGEGCGNIGYVGCCEGQVLKWCEGGQLEVMDCGGNPSCGWNAEAAYYDCSTNGGSDPSGTNKKDCGGTTGPVCGNGTCEQGEDEANCPSDCEPAVWPCGDGKCGLGENYENCPDDCTSPNCGNIVYEGCCSLELLLWCEQGQLVMINCENNQHCGWRQAEKGFYDCGTEGETDPSGKHPRDCSGGRPDPQCGDGNCEAPETSDSCPVDCMAGAECGDGKCEAPETSESCPADCDIADTPGCGNGYCEHGETPSGCPADCGGENQPQCGNGYCEVGENEKSCVEDCGAVQCGDGKCETPETSESCPVDCMAGAECGNGKCENPEDTESCPADCFPTGSICGNVVCEDDESCVDCPQDCGKCIDFGDDDSGCSMSAVSSGTRGLVLVLLGLMFIFACFRRLTCREAGRRTARLVPGR